MRLCVFHSGCLLSRRRREKHEEATTPLTGTERPDLFRRILLGAITALVVARPLVAGEDPGRLRSPEAFSGVFLNLLWLTAGLAGAFWLARSRRSLRLGGWVPLGLHIATGLILLSTAVVTCYRHPAWLITWEWATLAVAFLLVRAVAADTDSASDSAGGIVSALMASAVSLAVYALYQSLADKMGLAAPEAALDAAPVQPPDADFLGPTVAPPVRWICRATYMRSDTLVAVLLLTLPLVVAFGLFRRSLRHRAALILATVIALAAGFALVDSYRNGAQRLWRDGAGTAWRMFQERPWLGVGPGNFDRHSPRLQPVGMPEVLMEPGNAYLELLATGGIFVFLAVLAMLILIFVEGRRSPEVDSPVAEPEKPPGPRWEFYLGGVIGMLLGLLLRLIDQPSSAAPQSILNVGAAAVSRALIWFLGFALFEIGPWRTVWRHRAILIGISLTVLFGLISGATLKPAVLQLVVVMAALTQSHHASMTIAKPSMVRWVPVPLLFAVVVVYMLLVCDPVIRSANGIAEARAAARHYPQIFARAESAPTGLEKDLESKHLEQYLNRLILKPLSDARRADPYDNSPGLEFASWYQAYWKLSPQWPKERGLEISEQAAELDPYGTQPLATEFQLRLAYMRLDPKHFRPKPGARVDERELEKRVLEWREMNYREVGSLIRQIVSRDPALEARLRFRLAQSLFMLPDPERQRQGRTEAVAVWELEEKAVGPRWKLTREQRRLVRRWLKLPPEEAEWWLWLPTAPGPCGGGWALVPITGPTR